MPLTPETLLDVEIKWRSNASSSHWRIGLDPGVPFTFKAGQYATLGVRGPHGTVERPYSIASSPYESQLEFFIELVAEGELTPLLHRMQPGDRLSLRKKAKGRFVFDVTSGRTNHLLLCTSTGIAPYVSYVRTLLRDWKHRRFAGHRLFLIQGASRSSELGYQAEFDRLVTEVPWLTYVPTVSRPWEDPTWKGEMGRLDAILENYVERWSLRGRHTTAYLCGHPGMIEAGREILRRRGWQNEAIREETYSPPARPILTETVFRTIAD
jgi:ferredoxin/flavodoxin---NADP+ reductase